MELRSLESDSGIDLLAREMGAVINTIGTPTFDHSLLSMARDVTRCTYLTAFGSPVWWQCDGGAPLGGNSYSAVTMRAYG
jgi:hypothetical protein